MTRLDRRRLGRYARDQVTPVRPVVEPPGAVQTPDTRRGRFIAPDASGVADTEPISSPGGVMDAPRHRRASVSSAPGVIGNVNPAEAIAARTSVALLTEALQRLGLAVVACGEVVLSVGRPIADGGTTAWLHVLLGHHPGQGGRLWWWRLPPEPVGHDTDAARWAFWPADHPIGPVEEVGDVAAEIARLLEREGQGTEAGRKPRPAHDWWLP